jgi:hypothetical protein
MSPNPDDEKMSYQVHSQSGHDLVFTSIGRRVRLIVTGCSSPIGGDVSEVGVSLGEAVLLTGVTWISEDDIEEKLLVGSGEGEAGMWFNGESFSGDITKGSDVEDSAGMLFLLGIC